MDYARRQDSAFPGRPRRVFTAPTYAGPSSEQTSSTASSSLVETLYSHPSIKVVAFNAGPRPVFSHGKGIAPPVEVEPGSLPWSAQLERTIAAGAHTSHCRDYYIVLTTNQVNFASIEHPAPSLSLAAGQRYNRSCPRANAGVLTRPRANTSSR